MHDPRHAGGRRRAPDPRRGFGVERIEALFAEFVEHADQVDDRIGAGHRDPGTAASSRTLQRIGTIWPTPPAVFRNAGRHRVAHGQADHPAFGRQSAHQIAADKA